MDGVFANRTEAGDFVINELESRTESGCNVFIAAAFFTDSGVIERMVEKGCSVWLVVRLGFPTKPDAIERVYKNENVRLRYFTGRSFHPKLYIFGDDAALVGSANLTGSAMMGNQEVMVAIESSDDRFFELVSIFEEYFEEAEVMTPVALKAYRKIYEENAKHDYATYILSEKLLKQLGNTAPSNINRGKVKKTKKSLFISNFHRTYQEWLKAFDHLQDVYATYGYRKADAAVIPLRVEIDSFISFVRQRFAVKDSWGIGPLRGPAEQRLFVVDLIKQWSVTPWPYFEEEVVQNTYPRIQRVFGSQSTIMAASDSELFDALETLHSFSDRLRYTAGGRAAWKLIFPTLNDPKHVRETLSYLVFGSGDVVERMANAIFDPQYKIREFGRANVQELIGWLSQEGLPVINSRTTKVLRYFGYDVLQIDEADTKK